MAGQSVAPRLEIQMRSRPRPRLHQLCRTSVATHGDRVLMALGGTVSGNGQAGEAVETIGTRGTVETICNKHSQLLQIRPRSRVLPSHHHPARTTRRPAAIDWMEPCSAGTRFTPASVNNNNHRLFLPRLLRSRQRSSIHHSFHKNNHHRLLLPRRPRSRQFPPRHPPIRHQPTCHQCPRDSHRHQTAW